MSERPQSARDLVLSPGVAYLTLRPPKRSSNRNTTVAHARRRRALQTVPPPAEPYEGQVSRVTWVGDHLKQIHIENGHTLLLPRSACVTEGNVVRIDEGGSAWLVAAEGGLVQLAPSYWAEDFVRVGNLRLNFVVKEITEADEYNAYRSLTRFHYRDESLFGRTARLIVRNFHPLYPSVIGYIELTSPFYMNKARSRFLDAPFDFGGVSWDTWDLQAQKHHIHRIVRIARCVVYPEFRGLGLGRRLVDQACEFARTRWQSGTLKPLFIEISADMLRFVPFAEAAGMTWIGETEGNLARVAKDMGYLLRNRERVNGRAILDPEAHGIVQSQVNRMNRAAALLDELGISYEQLVERLTALAADADPAEIDIFRQLLSLPKPTYLMGLTPEADAWVQVRSQALGLAAQRERWRPQVRALSGEIAVVSLNVTRSSISGRTPSTSEVQRAFGLGDGPVCHPVLSGVSFRVQPGEVLLVTGASGSGKSTLLDVLRGGVTPGEGDLRLPVDTQMETLRPICCDTPLIEHFSAQGVGAALELLGWVGLSDAFVYLKRFDELSAGQQYRAMLAGLLYSGANVWVADEFCSNLDPVTAAVVADRAQQLARRLGVIFIVATAHPEHVLSALRPDRVLQLTTATETRLIAGEEYRRLLRPVQRRYMVPELAVNSETITTLQERGCVSVKAPARIRGLICLRAGEQRVPAVVRQQVAEAGARQRQTRIIEAVRLGSGMDT